MTQAKVRDEAAHITYVSLLYRFPVLPVLKGVPTLAMDTKKKETKDKEKKAKSSDKVEKDKKDKKPKASSKDREKVVKLMQKEYDGWTEEADETANIGACFELLEGAIPRDFPLGLPVGRKDSLFCPCSCVSSLLLSVLLC